VELEHFEVTEALKTIGVKIEPPGDNIAQFKAGSVTEMDDRQETLTESYPE
jgi:hypothetical protein